MDFVIEIKVREVCMSANDGWDYRCPYYRLERKLLFKKVHTCILFNEELHADCVYNGNVKPCHTCEHLRKST
jgi:hypothetical protein